MLIIGQNIVLNALKLTELAIRCCAWLLQTKKATSR
jgi:hypothetical protein